MGKLHLAVGVFLAFHVNFNFVTDFEVAVVAQFGCVDDTVGLESDVENYLAVVDGHHLAGDHIALLNGFEGFGVSIFQTSLFLFGVAVVLFGDLVPVEIRHGVSVGVFKIVRLARCGCLFFLGGREFFLSCGGCFFHYRSDIFGNFFHILFNFLGLFRSIQ